MKNMCICLHIRLLVTDLISICFSSFFFCTNEACIGYFGIRDIGLFFKGYWDI